MSNPSDQTSIRKIRRIASKPKPQPSAPTPVDPASVSDWLTLGKIVAPFGIRGEVKLYPETDFPERVATHAFLYLGTDHRPYALESSRVHGSVVLVKFATIPDMTTAETLRGQVVMIPIDEATPLPEDRYYIHDLIGLQAVHIDGTPLGRIADVYTGQAQDLLVVRRQGEPDVLVPLVKALVPRIDIAGRTLTIDPPEGLFGGEAEIVDPSEPG